MQRILLGIDPCINGAVAAIGIGDNGKAEFLDAADIMTIGEGAKVRVNVRTLRTWIELAKPDYALIERGGSMPKQGVASTFKFGRACGALEATLALSAIPYVLVEPSVWKRHHGLYGADKEASRQLALQLFPTASAALARKKDHQKAEAMLIALYGAKGNIA
jgi:Holliday junction resolvasome RuvABC endonuclease subunit